MLLSCSVLRWPAFEHIYMGCAGELGVAVRGTDSTLISSFRLGLAHIHMTARRLYTCSSAAPVLRWPAFEHLYEGLRES